MNVVVFSMTPLFRDKSMGGAQMQLRKITTHLAEQGHQVTILSTQRSDSMESFKWHENLQIVPIYRFKQPFPEPYDTPTFNIAAAIQDTGEYLARADVFYNHDGGLIFPYIWQDIPTVVSLRSILFSETLQSGYLFQGDTLIVTSEHTANIWLHTAGRFFPELKNRLRYIINGMDYDFYKPTPPDSIRDVIDVKPDEHRYIIFPHRPEAAKGILQTIKVITHLVHDYGMNDVRVLVPKWIDTGLAAHVREFYANIERDIANRGLTDNFIFHDWVRDKQMPQYYSLGAVTFAIGNYLETVGNTPYESIACGTPVIAARVGPYREMLPESVLVDYDDIEATAAKAAHIIENNVRVSDEMMRWLHTNFQKQTMVETYEDIIVNAKKRPNMTYRFFPLTDNTHFRLAPWCYVSEKGIYHDFKGAYYTGASSEMLASLEKHPDGFTFAVSSRDVIIAWYRDGYLVPLQGQV